MFTLIELKMTKHPTNPKTNHLDKLMINQIYLKQHCVVFMFKELTDSQWNALKAHIPKPAATGRLNVMTVRQSMQ